MSKKKQDIDSGSGKVLNAGEPVDHVDVEDGKSVGHSAEPESPESGDQPAKKGATELPPPPQKITRDEIYSKAKQTRETEIQQSVEAMDADQKRQYDRMIAEAGGGPDPFAEDEDQETEQPQAAGKAEKPKANGSQQPAKAATQTEPELDEPAETVTITVYGMQETVPRAEVEAAGGVEAYQKNRAADEKLKRLTTYEASLRDYDRQLAERAARKDREQTPARVSTERTDPSLTDDPISAADEQELAAKIVQGMFSGDEEQATKLLAQSLASLKRDAARAVQSQRTAEPVASEPGQTHTAQPSAAEVAESRARDEANAVFAKEFTDLQTPVLRSAVLDMVKQVAADPIMRGRPLAEITREAGMRVRNDVFQGKTSPGTSPADPRPRSENPSPPRQQTVPTDLEGRMKLKSRTVVTPMHETGQRFSAPAGDEQQYPSNTEYVNLLRKSRNQPPV